MTDDCAMIKNDNRLEYGMDRIEEGTEITGYENRVDEEEMRTGY